MLIYSLVNHALMLICTHASYVLMLICTCASHAFESRYVGVPYEVQSGALKRVGTGVA